MEISKKMKKNVFFYWLIFVVACAVLGYLICPDDTPNANDRHADIAKLSPFSTVKILKIPLQKEVKKVSFIHYWLSGQERNEEIMPYKNIKFLPQTQQIEVLPLTENANAIILDLKKFTNTTISEKDLLKNHTETRFYALGADKSGRDILSLLILGARISLGIGFMSVLLATTIGVFLGALAGFWKGWIDALIMGIVSVFWSIPSILWVVMLSTLLGKGVGVAILAIGLTSWVETARLVRGEVQKIKNMPYIEVAKTLGASNWRIFWVHIFPNIQSVLGVAMISNLASAILMEAGLSFLGLSVQSPVVSWGLLISESYPFMTEQGKWFMWVFPAGVIAVTVLSFNMIKED